MHIILPRTEYIGNVRSGVGDPCKAVIRCPIDAGYGHLEAKIHASWEGFLLRSGSVMYYGYHWVVIFLRATVHRFL